MPLPRARPGAALPGVRARLERDDPGGAVVTQLHQWWRRGEYAAVIRFYQEAGIPIRGMITAGALEGGDVMIVEPGARADRHRRGAHPGAGGRASSPAGSRRTAGRSASSRSRSASSTSTCCSPCSPSSWRRSAPRSLSGRIRALAARPGLRADRGPADDAFKLGVNAISLGGERVLSTAGAAEPERRAARPRPRRLRARPLDVHARAAAAPTASRQALRRERLADR